MTLVPVSRIRPGDVLTLPRGGLVTVERVDTYGPTFVVVRWWRKQVAYHDGWRIDGGRYLGSLRPLRPNDLVDRYREEPDPEPA